MFNQNKPNAMKKNYTLLFIVFLLNVSFTGSVMSWGTDKIVSPSAIAQHSIGAKQNGVLHAAIPVASLTGFMEVAFYISADNGETWTQNTNASHPNPSMAPVGRTKIIITSLDSVICLILQNNTIHLVNLESGVTGQFTQTGAQEFDAAAGSGNYIYLYVQEPSSNNIRRYGTNTGGLTWTGNTALVTGTGFRPRVTMWGTRLILNYYGPVAPDTVSSVIRAAFYNETAAGTLQAGTFIDVATNNTVKKKEFQSVINNNIVWFFFTEGDVQEVVKCRVSTDNGASYQPEFIIGGNAQVSASWFAAAPNPDPFGTFGVSLTFLTDSLNSPANTFDKMIYATASGTNPSTFNIPPVPFNTYNDTAVVNTTTPVLYPALVNYAFNTVPETGVAWLGANGVLPLTVYFDRYTSTVGLNESVKQSTISLFPSPASNFINLILPTDFIVKEIVIYSSSGQQVYKRSFHEESHPKEQDHQIDVRSMRTGIYHISARGLQKNVSGKFSISR